MMRVCQFVLILVLFTPVVAAGQRIKMEASRKDLEKAVQENPNDAAAHYNVALAYWNDKRWQDARRELETALAIEPRLAEAHLALAYMPYAQRSKLWEERFEDNLSDSLARVLEESRREERHAYLINPLVDRTIIGATTPKVSALWQNSDYLREVYDLMYQGFDDFIARRYEDAYHRYDRLLREWTRASTSDNDKPPMGWLWYHGLSAAQIGEYGAARADLQQLLQRSRNIEEGDELIQLPLRTNEYRYMQAVLEHHAGNYRSAIDLYKKALQHDIGLYMAHVRMADIYESQKRYDKAIEERRRAVNANPDDATLLMDLGVALGKAGQFAEAEELLAQAREANQRQALIPFWLGLAQAKQAKYEEARGNFTTFVEMAPARYQRQIDIAQKTMASIP